MYILTAAFYIEKYYCIKQELSKPLDEPCIL